MTLPMTDRPRVRRTSPVDEPLGTALRYNYADAFEVTLPDGDRRSAEQILRAGLQGAPAALRSTILVVHRHVLRFQLGLLSSPSHVLGWRITLSEPDVARLEISGPLIDAVLVARRIGDRRARLTTFVVFRRPTLAKLVFPFVAPVHRRVAAYLMQRAAH